MLDESRYQHLADAAYRRIADAFEDVDPDLVDCEVAGDVLTLTFKGGKRAIINTQRPTRQIWLAAGARAWHFRYDEATDRWMDDKGQGQELFATVVAAVKDMGGVSLRIA